MVDDVKEPNANQSPMQKSIKSQSIPASKSVGNLQQANSVENATKEANDSHEGPVSMTQGRGMPLASEARAVKRR